MAIAKTERDFIFALNAETGIVTVTNSKTKAAHNVEIGNMTRAAQIQAMLFGISRKVTNVTAGMKDSTLDEKWDAIGEAANRLNTGGDWNGKAVEASQLPMLELAMARVYGDTPEAVKKTLVKTMAKKGFTEEKKAIAYWLATEKIALAVLDIKRERLECKASSISAEDEEELRS